MIAANSLSEINHSEFFKILSKYEKKIPLMIFGISSDNETDVRNWSNGSIKNIASISRLADKSFYLFSDDHTITRQLAGLSLYNKNGSVNYFDLHPGDNSKTLMDLYFAEGHRKLPVFIKKWV